MPEVPRPLPLNELNLPGHVIVKTALALVRKAWSVKIKRRARARLSVAGRRGA